MGSRAVRKNRRYIHIFLCVYDIDNGHIWEVRLGCGRSEEATNRIMREVAGCDNMPQLRVYELMDVWCLTFVSVG